MAKGEPLLRDLRHEDTYAVVEHDVLMPDVAKIFMEQPDQAVLVYEKKKDKFLGVMYLYDYLRHYGSPPKGVSNIHKAAVSQCADTNIISINWDENVSQGWAKINKHKPKGVLLHDKEKEFVGYLSNEDMWDALEKIGRLDDSEETEHPIN